MPNPAVNCRVFSGSTVTLADAFVSRIWWLLKSCGSCVAVHVAIGTYHKKTVIIYHEKRLYQSTVIPKYSYTKVSIPVIVKQLYQSIDSCHN
jgi:hypothetical protein